MAVTDAVQVKMMSDDKPLLERSTYGALIFNNTEVIKKEYVVSAVCELKEYKEFTASPEKTRCDKCEEVYYVAFVREDDVYCYDCLIDEVFGEGEK